ncbi:MAG: acylphosphatase [Eubacterium sp.]|nr:acylphosphatase [Eubacterium sp.]
MEKVRKHIFFSGRVQGVGFRYKSYYIAQSLGLTGWARNCYDGRVEMEVQGTEADIDQMILQLEKQRYIWIEDISVKSMDVIQENSFSIRGY